MPTHPPASPLAGGAALVVPDWRIAIGLVAVGPECAAAARAPR